LIVRNSFLAALSLAALADAQQWYHGSVVRQRKISAATGPFIGGVDPNDQIGRAVICAGDIDGDGNPDLVSGAVGDDDGGVAGLDSDTGALWVHFLGSNGAQLGNAKISATSGGFAAHLDTRDQLGRALASIGDFDGDGVPDIAVGACRDDDGGVNRGAIYLLFLARDGSVKAQKKISSTQGGFTGALDNLDEFGRAIVSLGDLDGNGVIDLAVGAIGDDDGGADWKGAVWILFMKGDGSVLAHQKISDTQGSFLGILGGGDMFGFALANLGDLDGDGVPELAVGCPKDDDGGVRKGAVWILFMKRDGTVKGFRKISDVGGSYGLQYGGEFGSAIAGLGDLDGDGVPDMAVGAVLENGGSDDTGTVWVNFLRADGSVKSKLRINDVSASLGLNLKAGDWFGSAVATIPDMDGDGKPELAVGARFDDDGAANAGAVWLLFLESVPNVPPTPAFVVTPASGIAPLQVAFEERSSAGAQLFDWDFGDGTTSTQRDPVHHYAAPGAYTVTLTVTGPGGSAALAVPEAVIARHSATATLRNGSGTNVLCYSASAPVLGASWTAQVGAAHHPGAGLTVLLGSSAAHAGLATPAGELLLRTPSLGGVLHYQLTKHSNGATASYSLPLPATVALAGFPLTSQAVILGGAGAELCNAVDLVLGF
jgi:hypothetical protein